MTRHLQDVMSSNRFKVTVAGDAGVGKTSLLVTHDRDGQFPRSYCPTVLYATMFELYVDGQHCEVAPWDVPGHEDYDRLRPLSYPQTDVFLICFSVVSHSSFHNVCDRWVPEVRHYIPDVPILVVGCKADLRSEYPDKSVPLEEIEEYCNLLSVPYEETSALQNINIRKPFEDVVRLSRLRRDVQQRERTGLSRFFSRKRNRDDVYLRDPFWPNGCKIPVYNLVLVGDTNVGKTRAFRAYTKQHENASDYVPNAFNYRVHDARVDYRGLCLRMWDTPPQPEYDDIRALAYAGCDAFLVCFRADCADHQRDSHSRGIHQRNALARWVPEIRRECPQALVVLVACSDDVGKLESSGFVPAHDSPSDEQGATSDLRGVTSDEVNVTSKSDAVTSQNEFALFEIGSPDSPDLTKPIEHIVRALRSRDAKQREKQKKPPREGCSEDSITQPPLPPPAESPRISVASSCFLDDWSQALSESRHCDVAFITTCGARVCAHAVMLRAAAPAWARILQAAEELCSEEANSNVILDEAGMSAVQSCGETLEFHLSFSDEKACRVLLQHMYTGSLPVNRTDVRDAAIRLARAWGVDSLVAMYENINNKEDYLNKNIIEERNKQTIFNFRDIFQSSSGPRNLRFLVEGEVMAADVAVVTSRCCVLAAMLSGHFKEGQEQQQAIPIPDTSAWCFRALLHYLYCDVIPRDVADPVGLLVLANRLCLARLVTLCERATARLVHDVTQEGMLDSAQTIFGLIDRAEDHNAGQLKTWCLHFIAHNYSVFSRHPDFTELAGSHMTYLQEQQWPPRLYWQKLDAYKQLCLTNPKRNDTEHKQKETNRSKGQKTWSCTKKSCAIM